MSLRFTSKHAVQTANSAIKFHLAHFAIDLPLSVQQKDAN
jgi:hypothetical protein